MKTKEFAEEVNVSVKEQNAYKSTEDTLVSVIIPTYNSSKTISQCLKSVKTQTYRNIEIIVCDNFSDDSTVEIARSYRAKVFLRGKERAAQKNFGAKQASGDILYFIDSDFVLERDTVRRCVHAIQNSHAVVTVNRSSGKGLWARSIAYKRELLASDESVIAARFIRRESFFKVGGFDEKLTIGEDIDLHGRLIKAGFQVKKVDAVEWHIGEPETFRELVLRNYYYGRALREYLKKNKRAIVGHLKPFKLSFLTGILRVPSLLVMPLMIFQITLYILVFLGLIAGPRTLGYAQAHGFWINILYLHESSLPKRYTKGVISEREMRLIQEIEFVDKIYAVGKGETGYVGAATGAAEPKIETLSVPFSDSIRGKLLYHMQVFLAALAAMKKGNVRVVHATSPIWSGPVAISLAKIFRIPCIVEVRTNYNVLLHYRHGLLPLVLKRAFVRLLMRFTLTRSNIVIANSEFHKKECISLGVPPAKLFEVSPGVLFDHDIATSKKKKEATFTVGFMGRITELKGLEYLIRAAHWLLYEMGFQDFKVLIVGDGNARGKLEDLSQSLRVNEHVSFVGMTSNPFQWMCKFDVLVNPTLVLEALSMVNLEAYACKIPVIAFGHDQLPETVKDGETGFIIKPKDYKELARRVLQLYRDGELKAKLGNEGLSYLREKYLFESQVNNMRICLEPLIRKTSS